MKICAFFLTMLALLACETSTSNETNNTDDIFWMDTVPPYPFAYNLERPAKIFKLPQKLQEISGLGLTPDEKHLLAVQDEEDIVFFINKTTGEIEKKITFYKAGDYEGVEMVEDKVFVVKSSGTLFELEDMETEKQEAIKYNDFLDKEHNVEGLAYDKVNNRLLLACKGKAGNEAHHEGKRAIFAFDLSSKTINEEPAFVIDQKLVMDFLNRGTLSRNTEKIFAFFDPTQSYFGFSPSGLAIHPITGDIYVTSSIGKVLVIMNPEGKVVHIEKLDKKWHPQPEGIVFDKDGTMYISSEGKGGTPNICKFEYKGN